MEALKERLRRHEGFSLTPYKDDRGYWTVGIGHRIRKWFKPKKVYSIHEVEQLFLADVHTASDEFCRWKRHTCPKINLIRSEVCVELIFWIGLTKFLKFSKMIKAIKKDDWKLAALELYNSKLGKNYSTRTKELAILMWEGSSENEINT